MGVLESQLSVKFSAISQLTVKILTDSQLLVNPMNLHPPINDRDYNSLFLVADLII